MNTYPATAREDCIEGKAERKYDFVIFILFRALLSDPVDSSLMTLQQYPRLVSGNLTVFKQCRALQDVCRSFLGYFHSSHIIELRLPKRGRNKMPGKRFLLRRFSRPSSIVRFAFHCGLRFSYFKGDVIEYFRALSVAAMMRIESFAKSKATYRTGLWFSTISGPSVCSWGLALV